MKIFHSREEALNKASVEIRLLKRGNGDECALCLEKYIWEAHDFITGQTYGHPYITDERLMYWVERNMEDERKLSFEVSFQGMVAHIYHRLTGKNILGH